MVKTLSILRRSVFHPISPRLNRTLLLEEHGGCTISKQQYSLTDKVIVGGITIQSPLNESECIESCQYAGSNSPVVAKCSFKGIVGTNWSRTSDGLPEFDEYGIK